MLNEADVVLDLRVAGVVPVADGGGGELLEEEGQIGFERNLDDGLPVLDAQADAAALGFGNKPVQEGVGVLDKPLFLSSRRMQTLSQADW